MRPGQGGPSPPAALPVLRRLRTLSVVKRKELNEPSSSPRSLVRAPKALCGYTFEPLQPDGTGSGRKRCAGRVCGITKKGSCVLCSASPGRGPRGAGGGFGLIEACVSPQISSAAGDVPESIAFGLGGLTLLALSVPNGS